MAALPGNSNAKPAGNTCERYVRGEGKRCRHYLPGASFETFCIEQTIAHARLSDPATEAFFYRTHTGVEVDLLLKLRGRLIPIEIKLGTTPPDTSNLERCMRDLDIATGYVMNASHECVQIRRNVWMGGVAQLLTKLELRP